MKTTVKKFKKLTYVQAVSDSFTEQNKYPAIIFLHGSGTRGCDPDVLLGNAYFVESEKLDYDCVRFAPQCYSDSWFDIHEQLIEFIEYVISSPYIDKERVYMMGASMGGYATWQVAISRPDLFAAIVPICGGGTYWNAPRLCGMGVWAIHGSEDDAVLPEESIKMVMSICAAGGQAKLSLLEGVGHNSWTYVYRSREIHDWMFSHSKNHDVSPDEADTMYNDPIIYG